MAKRKTTTNDYPFYEALREYYIENKGLEDILRMLAKKFLILMINLRILPLF